MEKSYNYHDFRGDLLSLYDKTDPLRILSLTSGDLGSSVLDSKQRMILKKKQKQNYWTQWNDGGGGVLAHNLEIEQLSQ